VSLITVSAHFDGAQVQLDEPINLPRNAKLLVTVLNEEDEDREAWLRFAMANLARAYSDDEPEYPLECIKEFNPHYEGR